MYVLVEVFRCVGLLMPCSIPLNPLHTPVNLILPSFHQPLFVDNFPSKIAVKTAVSIGNFSQKSQPNNGKWLKWHDGRPFRFVCRLPFANNIDHFVTIRGDYLQMPPFCWPTINFVIFHRKT